MAGVRIEIDIQGVDAISKALRRLIDAGRDLSEPLQDMGEHLLNAHRERWEREVSPDGIPWEPLSEAYTTRKRRKRPAAGILIFDDLLRGTLRYQSSSHSLELGTDRPYGATHQFGRDFGRGAPIPARPFLGLSSGDEDALLDILREHLEATLRTSP